jgi:hypothetical protein
MDTANADPGGEPPAASTCSDRSDKFADLIVLRIRQANQLEPHAHADD